MIPATDLSTFATQNENNIQRFLVYKHVRPEDAQDIQQEFFLELQKRPYLLQASSKYLAQILDNVRGQFYRTKNHNYGLQGQAEPRWPCYEPAYVQFDGTTPVVVTDSTSTMDVAMHIQDFDEFLKDNKNKKGARSARYCLRLLRLDKMIRSNTNYYCFRRWRRNFLNIIKMEDVL